MLGRKAVLVAVTLLGQWAAAQSVKVQGTEQEANEKTVAPAAAKVEGDHLLPAETLQLTDDVLAELVDAELTNITLFQFADDDDSDSEVSRRSLGFGRCKNFPGDLLWPHPIAWKVLDLLTGGALIKTKPIASPCYDDFGKLDAAKCSSIASRWTDSLMHIADPTSAMSPLYQGLTCLPTPSSYSDNCTLGAYPEYVVKATNVAQVQLAVNFARTLNMRLVVKNTGHDFNGRSLGAGSLSIWTNKLKNLQYYPKYNGKDSSYRGPAVKVGAGILSHEIYEFADKHGVDAVGGEGKTVGFAGGYLAGGGHSPLTPMYGMAADQIISIDVVTPNGRFVTADQKQNSDLFWALRGGGGGTFGVVTSYTVKVYPKLPVYTVGGFTFGIDDGITYDNFWAAMRAYWEAIPEFNAKANYQYWFIWPEGTPMGGGQPRFVMAPWFAPGMTKKEISKLTAPLFKKWADLDIKVEPQWTEHKTFLSAFNAAFPPEPVGSYGNKMSSRLFPEGNIKDASKYEDTFQAIKGLADNGGTVIGFGINGGPGPSFPENAVNPAWRDAAMFVISWVTWAPGTSLTRIAELSKKLTNEWMEPWRQVTPGGGAYASEGDNAEPDFQQVFYGTNYDRLYKIKQKYDRWGLLYTEAGVGSEDWYVTDQLPGLPGQNGRLCRV